MIYGKTDSYTFYRVAARAGGKRVVRSFGSYSEAREYADRTVRDLARSGNLPALTPKETTDALAVREVLAGFFKETGRKRSAPSKRSRATSKPWASWAPTRSKRRLPGS